MIGTTSGEFQGVVQWAVAAAALPSSPHAKVGPGLLSVQVAVAEQEGHFGPDWRRRSVPGLTLAGSDKYRIHWGTAPLTESTSESWSCAVLARDLTDAVKGWPRTKAGRPVPVTIDYTPGATLTIQREGDDPVALPLTSDMPVAWRRVIQWGLYPAEYAGGVTRLRPDYIGRAARAAHAVDPDVLMDLSIPDDRHRPVAVRLDQGEHDWQASGVLMPVRVPVQL